MTNLTFTPIQIEHAVDAALARHGQIRAGDVLLRLGLVSSTVASATVANATARDLASLITTSADAACTALEAVIACARARGLEPSFESNATDRLQALIEACHLQAPAALVQPDLFAQGPANAARLALRRALLAWRSADAQQAWHELRASGAESREELGRYQYLLSVQREQAQWMGDPLPLESQLPAIEHLAQRLFATDAPAYLQPLWRRLADALQDQPFAPAHPQRHASHLWTRLGEHARARQSLEQGAQWRSCPQQVSLHARCCERLGDVASAMASWCELCFAFGDDAEHALSHSALLGTALADFLDLDPELPMALFPAWAVLCAAMPIPAPAIEDQRPAAELLRTALALRQAGKDSLPQRQRLHQQQPQLLALYLAARRPD